jgi:hypothetical protein
MATDVKVLLKQLQSAPRVLRIIAAVAAVDIVVILYAFLSLEDDVGERADQVSQLQSELTSTQGKTASTRKEIEQLPELRKLYDAALANGVLASQDRLKFINLAQELARNNHLSDFYFKLSPEQNAPLPGSKYQLSSTEVSLTSTGLLASDGFAFWEEILKRSQAHYLIVGATMERVADDVNAALPGIKAGTKTVLVKSELRFKWQSMHAPTEANNLPAAGKAVVAKPAPAPAAAAAQTAAGAD